MEKPMTKKTYILSIPSILWVLFIITVATIPKISQQPYALGKLGNIFCEKETAYQLDPWGSQGPRHTQQKSA